MHVSRRSIAPSLRGLVCRLITLVPLVSVTLVTAPSATPAAGAAAAAAAASCQFLTSSGSPSAIKHVIHIQFDNVHFRRDNPSVPSDLEQMPHLLNFIKNNGTLLSNEHTPLISHTANDLVTGITGVYGDQHGIPISNSFEVYNNSSVGAYNTSAFTYWTDKVASDPANPARVLPFQMIDSKGNNLQAPWMPYVKAGCNFGAVSTVNMVLESDTNDVIQVFGATSPEAGESRADRNKDFVGIAVHCADTTCSTVGNGSGSHAKPELGGQGFAALYGHKYVASQVSNITETNGKSITGFKDFNPSSSYTLGYVLALLQANVPVVYGYVADAHDSRNSCARTSPTNPTVADTNNGKPCGAYAPGEAGYVQQLKDWDTGFDQFFQQLDGLGINKSNTLFVFHSDENDHYAGSAPLNPGCDGITTACTYDRTRLGEITVDLPLLLQQKGLYDFDAARTGFTNVDLPYSIDFDTAPGFWLKGHPTPGSPSVRKFEAALAAAKSVNLYTGKTENLFRFLIDEPGMKALHMLTSDADRNAGVVAFGAEDNFNQIFSLINTSNNTSTCNRYPSPTDVTCLNNGFIWLHGNFAPDINNTWAAVVGPGVSNAGVDSRTWADHADLRPTMMTLLCLKDNYTHEGRALVEDLNRSALPASVQDVRGAVVSLGRTFKQLNAPVGQFGIEAIHVSTTAIKGDTSTYSSLESQLGNLVTERDSVVASIEAQLDKIPGCGGFADVQTGEDERGSAADTLEQLNARGKQVRQDMRRLAGVHADDEGRDPDA